MAENLNDDGGPAFPREAYVNPNGVAVRTGSDGMSLRAYLAGQAMVGVIKVYAGGTPSGSETRAQMCARLSVAYADALIAELAKGGK